MYWRYTKKDLSTKIRLFLGQRQAEAIQNYQNLTLVAGQLFGTEDKGSKTEIPQTAEELQASFSQIFGI